MLAEKVDVSFVQLTACVQFIYLFQVLDAAYVSHITSPVMASSGEEVVMECEADGVPRRDGMVKWLRDDHVLDSVSLVGENRAVLRLNASLETSGAYTCLADNGIGKV